MGTFVVIVHKRDAEADRYLNELRRRKWCVREIVEDFLDHLRRREVPFIKHVYRDTIVDLEYVRELARNRFTESGKGKDCDIKTFLIPDEEEDPPTESHGVLKIVGVCLGVLALAGLALSKM